MDPQPVSPPPLPESPQLPKLSKYTALFLSSLSLLLLLSSLILSYQNMQLRKQIILLQNSRISPILQISPTPSIATCLYNGKTYQDGEGFKDKCNSCSCERGQVACTLMACADDYGVVNTTSPSRYTCPSNGWIDCEPGPEPKSECSPTAMSWYKANCSDFQGAAL